jgi:hypothetical protein
MTEVEYLWDDQGNVGNPDDWCTYISRNTPWATLEDFAGWIAEGDFSAADDWECGKLYTLFVRMPGKSYERFEVEFEAVVQSIVRRRDQ